MNDQPRCRYGIAAALIAFVFAGLPATAPAIETIRYCGQSVRGRAELAGDLDCSGFIGPGVVIQQGQGRLYLNGFTISGAGYFGVQCLSSCQIIGPGTITGNTMDGVHVGKWVILRQVNVTNNGGNGVLARSNWQRARVTLKDTVIAGNGIAGVETDVHVLMRNSLIVDNGGHGVDVGTRDCTSAGRIVMFNSTVIDNGSNCRFSDVCADLTACSLGGKPPRLLADSTCGTSWVRDSGFPGTTWGTCSDD